MKYKHYEISAFTFEKSGGNLAGVVLDADNLSDNDMQLIAKEIGFSETSFVSKSNKADFKVRFFTPNSEVDLCGHATIATFFLLKKLDKISNGEYLQETKAGLLRVKIKDELILMQQKNPLFLEKLEGRYIDDIVESLNIDRSDLIDGFPIQIVSTGLKDILIPINSREVLNKFNPNFSKIKDISKELDVVGYHAFTIANENGISAYCRNFAPLYEIDEESATGTSNGALSAYLFNYSNKKENNFNFIQGESMNNKSQIYGEVLSNNSSISEIWVGGYAKVIS